MKKSRLGHVQREILQAMRGGRRFGLKMNDHNRKIMAVDSLIKRGLIVLEDRRDDEAMAATWAISYFLITDAGLAALEEP